MEGKSASDFFSESYASATDKFVAACREKGSVVERWLHPLQGPGGQELATYTAFFGRTDAPRIFIVISGTHGLEGLAGSGCQLSLIDQIAHAPDPVGYLFVHMLNPWGAAWGRRQNEENVDLNRNFLSFGAAQMPANDDYDFLHDALMRLSKDHPEFTTAEQRISEFVSSRGYDAYVAALFQGQYTQSRGINFGGAAPSWSNKTLKTILDRYVRQREKVLVLDLHTGLGDFGYGTVITTAAAQSAELARLRNWLGTDFVSLSDTQNAVPYVVSGDLGCGIRETLPDKEVTVVALEFGTYDVQELVRLQIEDCLQINSPIATAQHSNEVRERLTHFFYPRDELWRAKVTMRTQDIASRMLRGFLG
jgi:predicted deacylase